MVTDEQIANWLQYQGDLYLLDAVGGANLRALLEEVREARSKPSVAGVEARILYRHKKRGTYYEMIGIGKMQAEDWFEEDTEYDRVSVRVGATVDMREVAVYRSVENPDEIWVRPRGEFEDGRFEALKED